MSWINSRQFTIANRNGRHYVFRRSNAGNTEINIPAHIISKGQAIGWLKAHPNKVAAAKTKPKRAARRVLEPGQKPWNAEVAGKKVVRFVNKEGRPYNRPARVGTPNYFTNVNRAKGKRGPTNFTCTSLRKDLKKLKAVGRGRQGIVFLASRYSNGRYPFAVKVVPRDLSAVRRKEAQPGEVEFKIQNAVMDAAPDGVVEVRQILECNNFVRPAQINMANVQNARKFDKSKQTVILMEYASGGSLRDWITKQPRLTEATVHNIISSVIKTLEKIQKRYPEFRHNDLHLENVFVGDRGFLIGDFGWSRLEKMGTNPAVNTANGTSIAGRWGLGPKTDPRYDSHLFLIEMRGIVKRLGNLPKAKAFLDVAIPEGYRRKTDVHTSEGRLKYEDPCPGLPTLAQILKSKYITGRSPTPPRRSPPPKPRKPRVKALSASPRKRRASVRRGSAPARGAPGRLLVTNAQLLAMSPKSFLKLSRANKDRLLALRKGKGKANHKPQAAPTPAPGPKPKAATKAIVIPREVLKSAKFNKLTERMWRNAGAKTGAEYNNAWFNARQKAIKVVENRMKNNKPPFSPSPPKPKPKAKTPPKPRVKTPSPPKKVKTPPKKKTPNSNFKLSPSSGRPKIKSNTTGRWVYANLQSTEFLKKLAAAKGVNIGKMRVKANIARKIFGGL